MLGLLPSLEHHMALDSDCLRPGAAFKFAPEFSSRYCTWKSVVEGVNAGPR